MYPKTPELDKLGKVAERSQPIGEFLNWLFSTREIVLGHWSREDECTRCGCKEEDHDTDVPTAHVEYLVEGLGLSPEHKEILLKKLMQEGYKTTGVGCSKCGTSTCPRYVYDEEHLIPSDLHADINRILAEYFDINEEKAEEERRAILEHVRSLNRAK